MSGDMLAALIDAAYTKRADDGHLPRRPDQNTPWQVEPRRERRTRPTYRDSVGAEAAGRVDAQRKKEKR